MVILVVFNSLNVVKNLKNPDLVARQKPSFYTTLLYNRNKFFILELPWMHSDALISPHFAMFGTQTLYRITGKEKTNYAK